MTVTVHIDLGYEFSVKAPFKDVFDVLSDVPTSVGFFPKVQQLVDLGGGVYRWEMEKVGTAQVNIQTIYASKYVADRKKGTDVVLKTAGEVNVPLPGLMKMVVAPVVESEFEKLVDKYIANLVKHFGGEV